MGRWKPDAQGRLEQAAMELFSARGYEQTTVADIAEHAGLTERTFFRHYGDKREVLFAGSSSFRDSFVDAVLATPDSVSALEAVTAACERAATAVSELRGREFARARQGIIAANPELRERELMKLSDVTRAMVDALRARGVPEPDASMTAEVGMAAFRVAFERWVEPGERRALVDLVREALGRIPTIVD